MRRVVSVRFGFILAAFLAVMDMCVAVDSAKPAENKPVASPDAAEVESRFKLPEGFDVRLVAAEPGILNPMTLCVDEQGVIYVTEAHTYRFGTQGSPFQPPTNPIKRIEIGPDGRASRISIAAEGFAEPVMGVCARQGKVYATCLNELFVMDVAADGRLTNRKLLVKDAATPWNPFGMYRVVVGPDDKLWLCIADHPSSEPVTLTGSDGRTVRLRGQSGGLVRCNRDGSGLEMMVQGFRAPYGFDIDPWGHIWHISNGEGSPNIYVHVIPGMDYGYHSRNVPYAWLAGKAPLAPPVRDMGTGANTAAIHYFSSMFPREYWGNIFIANWGSHGANSTNRVVKRFLRQQGGRDTTGSADAGLLEDSAIFLTTTDPMFRPTGIIPAPDGGLYLADWHGRDDESDQTGRILKISYTGSHKPAAATIPASDAIARMKPGELCALLGHSNHLARELAQRALVGAGEASLESLSKVLEKGEPLAAAYAVWTLTRMNSAPAAQILAHAFEHPDARVRAHALRQLRQGASSDHPGLLSAESLGELAEPLIRDVDAQVRVEAALAMNSPQAIGCGLLAALQITTDPRLRYQIGFELGRRGDLASLEKLHASTDLEQRRIALIAANTARHENTALAAAVKDWDLTLPGEDAAQKLVAQLQAGKPRLTETSDQLLALEWMQEHPPAKPLPGFLLICLQDDDRLVQAAALRAVRLGAVETAEILQATLHLLNNTRHQPVQLEAVYTLGAFVGGGDPEMWIPWLKNPSKPVVTAVIRSLRQRERKPEFIQAVWPAVSDAARRHPHLAEEASFTFRQLGAAEALLKQLPAQPATPTDKEQISQAVLSRMKGASAMLGQLSFSAARSVCATCHSLRPGETRFGPSLADIGAAAQAQYLVESILEPSKVIKTGYQNESVESKDGRVYFGLVEVLDQKLLVKMLGAEPVVVPLSEVKHRLASPASAMPEGLHATMTSSELADLTAYLLSLKASN